MIRASFLRLVAIPLGWAAATAVALAPLHAQEQAPTLGAANYDKVAKLVRGYFGFYEKDEFNKANKELIKLLEETSKLAKSAKIAEPLGAVDDWREIMRRGLMVEKPTVNISWRADLRRADVPSPIDLSADEKELAGAFDNKLKAFVSVPTDYAKVAYPVIIGLHPMDDEVKAAKNLTKSKAIEEKVKAWATATYSKELLAKAIVICPIMDLAIRGSDNVSFSRPRWDSDEGALWIFRSFSEIISKNANFDLRRIYIDGHGSGASAALLLCARFPGAQTGAIVRGTPPQRIDFGNCLGAPVLFVGADSKEFHDTWKGNDGFVLEHHDALDDATLLAWMAAHPKEFAPKKVVIETQDLRCAAGYWLKVSGEDPTLEKLSVKINAVVDREKNEVTVVTNEKVLRFEIYLNDALLNLDKPIRVLHRLVPDAKPAAGADAPTEAEGAKETERFNGTVKRVMEQTLDWAWFPPFSNTGEFYVAMIAVELG